MLTCKICGYQHPLMISPSHLKKHGISGLEYKQKFPGSVLRVQTEASRQKVSKTKTGKEAWNKGKKIGPNAALSKAKKGKPNLRLRGQKRTDEQRARISEATKAAIATIQQDVKDATNAKRRSAMKKLIDSGWVNPLVGKKLSADHRANISRSSMLSAEKRKLISSSKIKKIADDNGLDVLSINNQVCVLQCQKCSYIFSRTAQIFRPSKKAGIDICPVCYPPLPTGYFTDKFFEANRDQAALPAFLYIALLTSTEEEFIKIGITTRTAADRWKNFSTYSVNVLLEVQLSLQQAWEIEQQLLKELNRYKYYPHTQFGGHTECFTVDALEAIDNISI